MPTRLVRVATMVLLLAGCDRGTASKQVASRQPPPTTLPAFRPAFEQSVSLFTDWTLPNSMTRPPGFDLNGYLDQVHRDFESRSAVFHSPAGVSFLAAQLPRERDDLRIITGLTILSETNQPSARAVVAPYTAAAQENIAEQARLALTRLTGAR